MGLRFEHQSLLGLLAFAPLLIIFFLSVMRRKRRLLERFADAGLLRRLLPSVSPRRNSLKAALLVAAFAFAFFSLARPQYGRIERQTQRKGVDLFIAIDTSESMLSNDIQPNRLASRQKE